MHCVLCCTMILYYVSKYTYYTTHWVGRTSHGSVEHSRAETSKACLQATTPIFKEFRLKLFKLGKSDMDENEWMNENELR